MKEVDSKESKDKREKLASAGASSSQDNTQGVNLKKGTEERLKNKFGYSRGSKGPHSIW